MSSETHRSKTCPYCDSERMVLNGDRRATCGSSDCLEKAEEAKKAQQARWGSKGVEPGSVAASMNREQRQAFEAWLKEADRDLGSMERWAKTTA